MVMLEWDESASSSLCVLITSYRYQIILIQMTNHFLMVSMMFLSRPYHVGSRSRINEYFVFTHQR